MRLAIQDSWPNLPESAEREFIARFKIACGNIGVECEAVVTSDEINEYKPDAVLVSHEFSRKLTGYPTIGMIWSPLSFFQDDPYRVKSLLSYDGYLVGNRTIGTYLRDIQVGLSARKPVSANTFLPTSYRNDIVALEHNAKPSMCYVGVHWDGARHRDLFDVLSRRRLVTCYGPEQSWKRIPDTYGGNLPFDGRSVIETIGRHGLALCLHKTEHRLEDTPSMRLFEAMSVGALPICDEIGFARRHLADFAYFIDMTQSPDALADRIEEILEEVRGNPEAASARARAAKAWFDANWSLEKKIEDTILPFIEEVVRVGRFAGSSPTKSVVAPVSTTTASISPAPTSREPKASLVDRLVGRTQRIGAGTNRLASTTDAVSSPFAVEASPGGPQCEVVMRSGGRDLEYVERAVGSVKAANSAEFPLGMIVVDYRGRADLEALCSTLAAPDFPIRYIRSESTGFRSTALWDGLKAVKAPFTAHIDDDDSVYENHYRHLAAAFKFNPSVNVCYSGVIRVEDEEGFYFPAPNYDGPRGEVIKERRELKFLDTFDLERLAKFDNFIQSNAWLGRTDFIQGLIGEDPDLVVAEDVYLYLLMAAHGPFGFTGSATALWHWRSKSSDNSMMAVEQPAWQKCIDRVRLRLGNIPFKPTVTFARLLAPAQEVEAVRRKPASLPALTFNESIIGGLAFKAGTILTGFFEPEIPGIWSCEPQATVLLPLGQKVCEEGGVLLIECLGSHADMPDRWLELGIVGGAVSRIEITDWSIRTVELPIAPGSTSPLVLNLTSSHMIAPAAEGGSERRALGGFIQSIRIASANDSQLSIFHVAGRGLPNPWNVPINNGVARGVFETRKRIAIRAKASSGGRLLLGDGEATLHLALSRDGDFFIPGRISQGPNWFVFIPDDPSRGGDIQLEFTDELGDTTWQTVKVDTVATLRDFRSLNDGSHQHVAASLTGTLLIDRGSTPIYLLLLKEDGRCWWETRPSYGAAWNVLFDLGKASTDEQGPFQRGPVRPLAELIFKGSRTGGPTPTSRELVAASILRSVLLGSFGELARGTSEAPQDFLLWLTSELIPHQSAMGPQLVAKAGSLDARPEAKSSSGA